MKYINHRINLKTKARIAGILYFVIFIVYPLASFFGKSQIIVSGDAMATANNILKNELFFRYRDRRRSSYFSCGTRVSQGVS